MKRNLEKAQRYLANLPPQKLAEVSRFKDSDCTEEISTTKIIIPNALALQAFSTIPKDKLSPNELDWIAKNIEYIKTHEKGNRSFNYLINDMKKRLPDDLDDTAYCLTAIHKHNVEINEEYILKMLGLESRVGGPYRTWYIDPESTKEPKWLDIDPIVNANLLYFMSEFGIDLPKTERYLHKALEAKEYSSPYYPSGLIFLYFMAKYAKKVEDKSLMAQVDQELSNYDDKSLNLLEKIMHLIATTVISGKTSSKILSELISYQDEDGSMPHSRFCYDIGTDKKTYVSSKAITTSFFLELLALNTKFSKKKTIKNLKILKNISKQKKIIESELKETSFHKEIRELFPAKNSYKALHVPNSVAYDLKVALSKEQETVISDLAIGIYFSWLGYTLSDDILDEQRGTKLIPVANTLIRLGWKYFNMVIEVFPSFEQEIHKAFVMCDESYFWESEKAKFKENQDLLKSVKNWGYSYIEKRMQPYLISLKHIPLILGLDESKGASIYSFFRSQVIIDQLNDDAHDWEEDYSNGNLTFVLARIFTQSSDPRKHQEIFWERTLPEIIDIAEQEYTHAKEALKALEGRKVFMERLIERSISPIRKAEVERDKTKRILKNF